MRSFRQRPVGWRNESHRHYLAAKGVKTRYFKARRRFEAAEYMDESGVPQERDMEMARQKIGAALDQRVFQVAKARRQMKLMNEDVSDMVVRLNDTRGDQFRNDLLDATSEADIAMEKVENMLKQHPWKKDVAAAQKSEEGAKYEREIERLLKQREEEVLGEGEELSKRDKKLLRMLQRGRQ